ncbi:MAG: hypothetical protein R2849_09840 [Thermomicrobiales bacterium]
MIDLERSAETEREIDDLIQRIEADSAFIPATALTWNAGDSLARLEVPLAMLPGEPESYDAARAAAGRAHSGGLRRSRRSGLHDRAAFGPV